MTDPHGPDRLDALIVKSAATQMASAQVLREAYDLLQAAHAAIERARSLQRRQEITSQDDASSPERHGAPNLDHRDEIGSVGQDAGPYL
jgi:type II secretory pathway pseudopilin PulG